MEIIINNFSRSRIDSKILRVLARKISKKKNIVSVSFVTKGKIKALNTKYRKKNSPTDVLSFNMGEGRLLGDVIICPEVAKRNSLASGVAFKFEIARLLAHGILHLLGYKHGKSMFDLEDSIAGEVC